MTGSVGWNATYVRQFETSIVVVGFFKFKSLLKIDQTHKTERCSHHAVWLVFPYATARLEPLLFQLMLET